MYSHNKPETAPVRRRIVQQPLRTEAAYALISAEFAVRTEGRATTTAQTAELEALLKRHGPLITFPSISHFFAEPPRREPWAAVVVTRAGAWDPRFDGHVRRRRSIALFAVAEEVYGWPEAVSRVRDLTELSAWLEALNAPEPNLLKAAERRDRRAKAKAALGELSPNRPPQGAASVPAVESSEDAPGAIVSATPVKEDSLPEAPTKPGAKARTQSLQLELAMDGGESVQRSARRGARVDTKPPSPAPRKQRSQSGRPASEGAPRSTTQALAAEQSKRKALRASDSNAASQALERALMLAAAELGLVHAHALLAGLRKRAAR